MTIVTRFAPSPTGRLHLGHAYSALFAWQLATDNPGGRFILRIEDIDYGRCHREHEDGIYEDLAWLGLHWEQPVRRQSEHFDDYRNALTALKKQGLLYPCFCSRKEIKEEAARSASAPHGPEGLVYPGTCRALDDDTRSAKIDSGMPYCLRLDMDKTLATIKTPLYWTDRAAGRHRAEPEPLGDIVLARKDIDSSYHLSVTIDDHLQGITLVTRGQELLYATPVHRLLQALLGLDVPEWHHHPMLTDEHGKRLAKRDASKSLQYMREQEGLKARQVIKQIMDMTESSL